MLMKQVDEVLRRTTVRTNYVIETRWTRGEASRHSGLTHATIKKYCQDIANGKARHFTLAGRVGPLEIDAETFKRFIETGEPQG